MKADVIFIIGANPTDGHPVFASQMKRRLRQGAKLIVVDPRAIDLVRTPHIEADYHLQLRPGTNVALINAIAHVIVTEGLVERRVRRRALRARARSRNGASSSSLPKNSPEAMAEVTGVPADLVRGAARLYATGRQRRDLLRPRRHRAQPGLDHGDGHRQPRDGHRQPRPRRRRRQPAARPEQRAGLLRHGLVPARVRGYRHVSDDATRALFEQDLGRAASSRSRACASRTCSKRRSTAASRRCTSRARTSRSPTRTRST